ncbi:uncharacterized protein VTP21DRAFT_3190 [Calcarisporiella thermophila]|uniref:uncharacterized protein n=1 Tax=Calcarisporiella thermophila TaxID=911321 RepID=UPI0037439277
MHVFLATLLLILVPFSTLASGDPLQEAQLKGSYEIAKHPAFPNYSISFKKPTICDPAVNQVAGYLDTDANNHFFFWFFESRSNPQKDPLVLWLNGGPGCSSMLGLFMELGPCRVRENGGGTVLNQYGWNNNTNIIFLDQPANVGYSYGSSQTSTSLMAAKDVYAFLQIFLQKYPQYANADFHVAGESYAGHYIPNIGSVIHKNNKGQFSSMELQAQAQTLQKINLKSLLIGNGATDGLVQYKYYEQMGCRNSYNIRIFSDRTCAGMNSSYPTCAGKIRSCYNTQSAGACTDASNYCDQAMISPFPGSLNIYDIRRRCEGGSLCYPIISAIESYLNRNDVKKELGVRVSRFQTCSGSVGSRFARTGDGMFPAHRLLPPLLEDGIRILIYVGDADYICNWYGNKAWTIELPWSGQSEFKASKDVVWGGNIGELRKTENNRFAFLRVYAAGHMVPYDQPKNSLIMFNRWISNEF